MVSMATFIGIHGDLVAVPTNLGPGVGGRSIRHRLGFGLDNRSVGFVMAMERMRVWGSYCLGIGSLKREKRVY